MHDNKHREGNPLQSLRQPEESPCWEYNFEPKEFQGNILNSISYRKVQGQKHLMRLITAEPKMLRFTKAKSVIQKEYLLKESSLILLKKTGFGNGLSCANLVERQYIDMYGNF